MFQVVKCLFLDPEPEADEDEAVSEQRVNRTHQTHRTAALHGPHWPALLPRPLRQPSTGPGPLLLRGTRQCKPLTQARKNRTQVRLYPLTHRDYSGPLRRQPTSPPPQQGVQTERLIGSSPSALGKKRPKDSPGRAAEEEKTRPAPPPPPFDSLEPWTHRDPYEDRATHTATGPTPYLFRAAKWNRHSPVLVGCNPGEDGNPPPPQDQLLTCSGPQRVTDAARFGRLQRGSLRPAHPGRRDREDVQNAPGAGSSFGTAHGKRRTGRIRPKNPGTHFLEKASICGSPHPHAAIARRLKEGTTHKRRGHREPNTNSPRAQGPGEKETRDICAGPQEEH
ncbi:hypothetical protein NDU88_005821 [Pleurodeles waltl]|uniref:Uncharacterized protein n=1 Tax=Pleurodeles waltl TaxID=8319 RepID=A0AAV7W935_PLEWA|nr:hypothetical protein NDU88_005821 [Pleurodeles waltl]